VGYLVVIQDQESCAFLNLKIWGSLSKKCLVKN
jgi:hypothetical protein